MTQTPPGPSSRPPRAAHLAWFMLAMVLGLFFRLYFISSHGTWDTEYWKAWAFQTRFAGIAQAYGGADAVPAGDFLPQLMGQKPRFEVAFRGRDYVIDYPPLALAVWGKSWTFFTSRPRPYRGPEAENLAVKFPPLLGDLLSVVVLLWAFRGDRRKAFLLAGAYWLFPLTWVSSSLHGFFDGFVAPFLLLSLLLAPASPLLAGATFAVTCLIKPTAAVALPILLIAAPRASWTRILAAGATASALVLTPFALAGTLPTAVVHIVRIFSQERISGGYANPWWLIGHASLVRRDLAEWKDPISYVSRADFVLPLGLFGFVAVFAAAAWMLSISRNLTRPRSFVYLAALILFSWGVLTVGVHDNHNHPLFILLAATGLGTPFLRGFTLAAATSTMLGSISLHGLGRFYGAQWKNVLPLADSVARFRMALGFDVTLILAVVNTLLLVAALYRLKRTLEEIERE